MDVYFHDKLQNLQARSRKNDDQMKISFTINGRPTEIDVDPNMPLLWAVRDVLKLKGTKYGCGKALCGACSLHIDGQVFRSCSYPVRLVEGKEITTLEGLSADDDLHPIQQAWIEENVPQCGYCQPGFMMAGAGLIASNSSLTEEEIKKSISNICRCGTHPRIVKAIKRASEIKNQNESLPS